MLTTAPDNVDQALRCFGLTEFRPGQREVIDTVLSGRDVLCVMPTGGGKSLCYQLPALCLPGVTLVISPLIALMKDQEDQLRQRNIAVTSLHSGLELAEQRDRLARIQNREFNLVYVAPERFRNQRFVQLISETGLSLLAVDEAHCISEWGHDFRPDYARLGWFRQQLGNPPTIALTATATDIVRRDIVDQLNLHHPAVFIRGFDRPNLSYRVTQAGTRAEKLDCLRRRLASTAGSTIIYAASRKSCEEVGNFVRERTGRKVVIYHAGMMPDQRRQAQDAFMQGFVDVVVATNAFGMGVDKPDIRSVIHYNVPGTLEAYYQEAGRAGRDGLPAECEMLFSHSDRIIQQYFIDNEYPDRDVVLKILAFLRAQPDDVIELTRAEMSQRIGDGIGEMAIGSSLKILEQAGVVERLRSRQNLAIIRIHETGPDLTDLVPKAAKTQRKVLRKLEQMVGNNRGQDCFFHPDALARQLEIERSSLIRALQELCERLQMEYIRPFRGSATRLLDRDTPPDKLPINFEELYERKLHEYEKLERVFAYAQAVACRRQQLLSYFGESSTKCGNCDNCNPAAQLGQDGKASAHVLDDEGKTQATETVMQVVRGIEELRGRFGKTMVAQTLTGSNAKPITRFGLQRKQCFGTIKDLKQPEVVEIIDALISIGVARQEGDRLRPTVALTEKGQQFLQEPNLPANLSLSQPLWAKLSLGSAPVISERRQMQAPEPEVLETSAPPMFESSAAVAVPTGDPAGAIPDLPSYIWTWKLLQAGFSVGESAAIRGLTAESILGHAIAAASEGRSVPLEAFEQYPFPPAVRPQVKRLADVLASFR